MPMNYFDTKTHGEVLSRVTNDVDTLSQSLNQSATQIITSFTTIIGILVMMLSISPLMTVVALLILPVVNAPDFHDCKEITETLQESTRVFGTCQRTGRGGLWRPQHCQSI